MLYTVQPRLYGSVPHSTRLVVILAPRVPLPNNGNMTHNHSYFGATMYYT